MYLANISGIKQPTQMVTRIASPVASRCTSPNSSVAISHREGLRPLGTSLTMSHSNALPEILTCKSPAALRNLCNKRSKVEATRLANYETYTTIIGRSPKGTHKERKSPLTAKQRERYDALRAERYELMTELGAKTMTMKTGRYQRFRYINIQLHQLTKHHGYSYR
jgi:hypothetical protein